MFAYELGGRIYCANCYTKLVAEGDRKPIHIIEGTEFYYRFQDNPVECVRCGISIQHDHLDKTSYKSLGGPDKKED